MDKEIGRIPKNEQVEIVLKVDAFGGKPGLTIREFSNSERYTGFTKSGTKIPVEKFEEFKTLINSIKPEDFPAAEDVPSEEGKEGSTESAEQAALPSASEDVPSEEGKTPEDKPAEDSSKQTDTPETSDY